ncbi:MAG: tRNA pseudouridine(38-40) synthase TruA [Deltaproteobacteria bacterium]|nr:tRNA pseudouridine(38-40) synthase TruA [Deltaproteobacteria bacterium]
MMKYKITLEYDGTNYSGWQNQKNAKSIQGTLIHAAQKLFGPDVDIQGAGRTDAGVHALEQVAHLSVSKKMPAVKIRDGLNDLLPANINILKVEEAPTTFHARHHAKARSYIYIVSKSRTAFGKKYVWWIKDPLNIRQMRTTLSVFKDFHNFASFADKRRDKDSSDMVLISHISLSERDDLIFIRIVASHFLWKMVRRLVGILVEVGRGNLSKADVEDMLVRKSDIPAKFTAPPSGLFLEKVYYSTDKFVAPDALGIRRNDKILPVMMNRKIGK